VQVGFLVKGSLVKVNMVSRVRNHDPLQFGVSILGRKHTFKALLEPEVADAWKAAIEA